MTDDELAQEARRFLSYPNRAPSTAHVQLLEMVLNRWRPVRVYKDFRCPKCGSSHYTSRNAGDLDTWERVCRGCNFMFPQWADHLFWVPVPVPEYTT